jgi:hypothetical protein
MFSRTYWVLQILKKVTEQFESARTAANSLDLGLLRWFTCISICYERDATVQIGDHLSILSHII